jgi:hypothetical protein
LLKYSSYAILWVTVCHSLNMSHMLTTTDLDYIYCDVLPESQNVGADWPSTFPTQLSDRQLTTEQLPSLCNGNTARTIGECNCYTTDVLEAFPSQRNPYSTCSQYGRPGGYIREKTFSSGFTFCTCMIS